jgi:hypothetical protein
MEKCRLKSNYLKAMKLDPGKNTKEFLEFLYARPLANTPYNTEDSIKTLEHELFEGFPVIINLESLSRLEEVPFPGTAVSQIKLSLLAYYLRDSEGILTVMEYHLFERLFRNLEREPFLYLRSDGSPIYGAIKDIDAPNMFDPCKDCVFNLEEEGSCNAPAGFSDLCDSRDIFFVKPVMITDQIEEAVINVRDYPDEDKTEEVSF